MIKKIDHFVITTEHLEECMSFYQALGFKRGKSTERYEIFRGEFKINVHVLGHELSPYAKNVTPGSADFCFEIDSDIEATKQDLINKGIDIELGPVSRSGVRGSMKSLYMRDPDGNLIELCKYL